MNKWNRILSQLLAIHMFNPFPNKRWVVHVCSTRLSKTLRVEEKLLITSNFSFSLSVFYTFGKLSAIFINFEIVFCTLFQFGRVKNLSSGKGLTHYQTTNFRLFQTERVSRRQFQIWRKWKKVIQTGRKHCGKRRNCLLRAISPFPTVFSKGLFLRGIKRCHCVGMG